MNTPITDNLWQAQPGEGFVFHTERIKDGIRRLETDRAVLMEALEASEMISQAIKRGKPMMKSRFNAMVDNFEGKRQSALTAARANFPTP